MSAKNTPLKLAVSCGLAIGITGCYFPDATQTKSRTPTDVARETGQTYGPTSIRPEIDFDEQTLALKVEVKGDFAKVVSREYATTINHCKTEASRKAFKAHYIAGSATAGAGGIIVGLDAAFNSYTNSFPGGAAYAGIGIIVGGVIMVGAAAIVDLQHEKGEIFDCESEAGPPEYEPGYAPPTRRRLMPYTVDLTLGARTRSFSSAPSGLTVFDVSKEMTECPDHVVMNNLVTRSLPEMSGEMRKEDLKINVTYSGVTTSQQEVVTVFDLKDYIAAAAKKFASKARSLNRFHKTRFVVENKLTRTPILGAQVSITVLDKGGQDKKEPKTPEAREAAKLRAEIVAFRSSLDSAKLPCETAKIFDKELEAAQQAAREEEYLASTRSKVPVIRCELDAEKCEGKTGDKANVNEGQIFVELLKGARVLIEIRAENYHFSTGEFEVGDQELNLSLTSTKASSDKKKGASTPEKNHKCDPKEAVCSLWLSDVGQRIRSE